MIYVFLILTVVILAVLEFFWAHRSLDALAAESSADKILAEPGEIITWTATVKNKSRMPIPFVRLTASFPVEANLHSENAKYGTFSNVKISRYPVEERLSLMPRQRAERRVRFSLPQRGQYTYAPYHLASGDLLGFRESEKQGDALSVVIMPERSKQQAMIDALGGFLGEVSVRRFILEDPILTIGFRDYTGREPMKSISWTRSAVAGSLQVKQFDHTAERHVVVLLNTEGARGEILEECLRLTRTVCEKLEEKKIPYGFRTNGSVPGPVGKIFSMAEGLGQRHLNTILYGLGRADSTCYYSFRYLAEKTLRYRSSNESYIVITPPLDVSSRATVRKMESVVGGSLCVLTAEIEETEENSRVS